MRDSEEAIPIHLYGKIFERFLRLFWAHLADTHTKSIEVKHRCSQERRLVGSLSLLGVRGLYNGSLRNKC